MKVLFLDFDGVLNSEKYIKAAAVDGGVILDPSAMERLQRLILATDAHIVLTSSWRDHWECDPLACDTVGTQINAIFASYGLSIFDKTPRLHRCREDEIEAWLTAHPATKQFAVVDDRFLDSAKIRGRFVKTDNYKSGLDTPALEKLRQLLT